MTLLAASHSASLKCDQHLHIHCFSLRSICCPKCAGDTHLPFSLILLEMGSVSSPDSLPTSSFHPCVGGAANSWTSGFCLFYLLIPYDKYLSPYPLFFISQIMHSILTLVNLLNHIFSYFINYFLK